MERIRVSNPEEAVVLARQLFLNGMEWVLASFDGSVAGVMWDGKYNDLLLHCSEKCVGTANYASVDDAKVALLS